MPDPIFTLNRTLQNRLNALVLAEKGGAATREEATSYFTIARSPRASPDSAASLNVVVTANEVTDLHGTGPLVKRVCRGWRNVFSIRARNDWGEQDFGDWHVCLPASLRTRAEYFSNVLRVLHGRRIRTVLCVPFLPDEFYTSIAIQECFGAKLCVYLMDDQNVATRNIPDVLMREFLNRCALRLATHPELQGVYEQKYGLPFHVLPAIVPGNLVPAGVTAGPAIGGRTGALIGSFWDQRWYDCLCSVLTGCGWRIDWFGNNKSPWFDLSPQRLTESGITAHGVIPEKRLASELAKYPFVIVPTGALDGTEGNAGVARLSLPGRILFAAATAHTPVLVVGSPATCGARFVKHFGIGEVVPYETAAVAAAMDRISAPEAQQRMRRAAARIAPVLSDAGISGWLADSIELGRPADRRFEEMFSGYDRNIDIFDGSARAMAAQ